MNQIQQSSLAQMPKETLAAILRAVGEGLEGDVAAGRLRSLGAASAASLVAALGERLTEQDLSQVPAERFWSEFGLFLEEMGWGTVQQESLHPGVLSVESTDWFEAVGARNDHPCCHFTTGVFAELLRIVSDADIAAMEVECLSCGDAHCRFLVGSPVALDELYEGLADGVTVSDAVAALH